MDITLLKSTQPASQTATNLLLLKSVQNKHWEEASWSTVSNTSTIEVRYLTSLTWI